MIDINHNHDESKLSHVEFDALLGDLRDQDPEAWRRAIKTLRPFLKRLARRQLPPRLWLGEFWPCAPNWARLSWGTLSWVELREPRLSEKDDQR